MDFGAQFQNQDGLLSNWENCCQKIISFLNQNVKDKNVKEVLKKIMDGNLCDSEI